jgi:predicted RNA binding protein YcfA (HicA-like mRNA interferase family)
LPTGTLTKYASADESVALFVAAVPRGLFKTPGGVAQGIGGRVVEAAGERGVTEGSRAHLSSYLTFRSSNLDLKGSLTGKDLLRLLRKRGCVELRRKGSHVVVQCGKCQTVVPVHAGEDLGPGLLRAIERDLEPCLEKGWLRPHRS